MNDQNEITEILNDGVAKKMELRRSFYEWLDKNPDSNVWQWILNKLNEQQQVKVEPEVKVNFAKVNEVIDELMEKNLNKERWQMRPDNWREFVGYEKALKELKTILSKISA